MVNDKQFYISYIFWILIAILIFSIASAYYSYLANKKAEQVYSILEYSYLTNKKVEQVYGIIEEWELTK